MATRGPDEAAIAANANAESAALDLHLEGFAWSDGLPLRTARRGMHGARPEDATRLVTHGRVEVGAARGPWRLAAFWRHDDRIAFHEDTADLLYALRNDQPLDAGREYRLYVDADSLESYGVAVERMFGSDDLRLGVRLNLLRASALIDGRLDGRLRADAGGEVAADAVMDYAYSTDDVLQRPRTQHDAGWGGALDLSLHARLDERWTVDARVDDALAVVRWADAPYTRARLRLARPRLLPDGTLDNAALLSGRESARTRWQRLPVRYELDSSFKVSRNVQLYARVRGVADDVLPEFGLQWEQGVNSRISLGWNTRASALLLGFTTAASSLRMGADTLDPERVRLVDVDMRVSTGMASPGTERPPDPRP